MFLMQKQVALNVNGNLIGEVEWHFQCDNPCGLENKGQRRLLTCKVGTSRSQVFLSSLFSPFFLGVQQCFMAFPDSVGGVFSVTALIRVSHR